MATTYRNQRDKPHPKLTPRPTAASTARAARNATNRNVTLNVPKQSPTKASHSPCSLKGKLSTSTNNNAQKTDSKTSVSSKQQSIHNSIEECERLTIDHVPIKTQGQNLSYVIDTGRGSSIMILEETVSKMDCERQSDIQEHYGSNKSTKSEEYNEKIIESSARFIPDDQDFSNSRSVCSSPPPTPQRCSRPQTPRMASRPSTPAKSTPRQVTPVSRPTTPLNTGLTANSRPRTPASTIVQQPRVLPSNNMQQITQPDNIDGNDIKAAFARKNKQLHKMKKELDFKQQEVLKVFESLRELHERMVKEGIQDTNDKSQWPDIVVFNVADWAAEEIAQLCRDAAAASSTNGIAEIFNNPLQADDNSLAELSANINDIPAQFANLCMQAFSTRQEIIDWVKDLMALNEDGDGEPLKKIAYYSSQGHELCEALRELKIHAAAVVQSVTQFSRRTCQERSSLIGAGEILLREVTKLRAELDSQNAAIQESGEGGTCKSLEEIRRQLEEERAGKTALKDKLSITESQLRATRSRVTKMDRQLRESEASIASLTGTVKTLEDQSRQREVQLEARARKLRESLKTGEVTSGQLAQQRDALQNEIHDLKEVITKMTTQHKTDVKELTDHLNELKTDLDVQNRRINHEIDLKKAEQEALQESQKTIEQLNAKISDLESSKLNPELPTEREMDLWAELQAIKETLRMTEEEAAISRQEKVRFLETLTKITETDNKVGMQQKLVAELMSKEEIIGKMKSQIRELTKTAKFNEQKLIQYEQYVCDLQVHNRSIADQGSNDASGGAAYQDMQQEVMNLRMGLLDSTHRNEELSEMLMQKEQQLEQQDKTSRYQAKVIKMRDELINMLKNKETEQSRELTALQHDLEHRMKIVEDVNKQIAAKADEIQELFSTLETKQQQIHKLEKIVLALEEQQKRAQGQRVRNEEKIAALEHELAGGGNRRERRFLFF